MKDAEFLQLLTAIKRELNCYTDMVYKVFETLMQADTDFKNVPTLMDTYTLASLFNTSVFMRIWKEDQSYIFTKDDAIQYWGKHCYKEVCNNINREKLKEAYPAK